MKIDLKLIRKREQTRNRVRLHRGVNQIILEQNEKIRNELKANRTHNINNDSEMHQFRQPMENEHIDRLRLWVHEHNISQRAISALLKLLICFGLDFLPMDCRTLMQTPKSVEIIEIANGKFWYDGIGSNLRRILPELKNNLCISLKINIDGLPLFESSKIQMWPILVDIHGKKLL